MKTKRRLEILRIQLEDELLEIFKERELLYFIKGYALVCSEAKELIDNIRDIRSIILYMEFDVEGIEEYIKTDRLTSLIHEN